LKYAQTVQFNSIAYTLQLWDWRLTRSERLVGCRTSTPLSVVEARRCEHFLFLGTRTCLLTLSCQSRTRALIIAVINSLIERSRAVW